MSDRVYLMSMQARAGKVPVALGMLEQLAGQVGSIGVFRPVVAGGDRPDPLVELLRQRYDLDLDPRAAVGCSYDEAARLLEQGVDRLVQHVLDRFGEVRSRHEFVLCVGTDYAGPSPVTELDLNATLATNLGAPVVAVVPGDRLAAHEVAGAAARARAALTDHGARVVATVVNRLAPPLVPDVRGRLADQMRADPTAARTYVLPDLPVLAALTVEEVATALSVTPLLPDHSASQREVEGMTIGTGHVETVLAALGDGSLLVTSLDRTDLALVAAAAATSPGLPTPSAVLLTLGGLPNAAVRALLAPTGLPVLATEVSTYDAMHTLDGLRAEIRPTSTRKIAAALGAFAEALDAAPDGALVARIQVSDTDVVTPMMFSARLLERARKDQRHIVLPEGQDLRVLRAAEEIVRRGVAGLTVLGDPADIRSRAEQAGVDLDGVDLLDPAGSDLLDELAAVYAQARAHKGVTHEQARDVVTDPSYFGTLLVHTGRADGMVSGAAHTTAATIRPALEVIRTAEGVSLVSSTFFMCLPEKVLAFADCAVVPDPDPEQLADIAVSTAETARAFGIEPRVAMVSYSTGTSGTGADVEKVRRATEIVAGRRPDLPLAGPIQYDAAVDPVVAAAKLPGNETAGRASVLVFPDLNTGNTTYKAVQRAADAIAVGPVLQGLRRPVNDLSRGCSVADIVHTVAITAVQAQTVDGPGEP